MNIKKRKGQQEIVGFIIIVIIIVIMGVVFLGMFLKRGGEVAREDAEISNFLVSSAKVTTDCVKGNEPNYMTLGELREECFLKRNCLDGRSSCEVLKDAYERLLEKEWSIGKRGIRGYEITFYYQEFLETEEGQDYGPRQEFLEVSAGNLSVCNIKRAGSYSINIGTGDIVTELEICKE